MLIYIKIKETRGAEVLLRGFVRRKSKKQHPESGISIYFDINSLG